MPEIHQSPFPLRVGEVIQLPTYITLVPSPYEVFTGLCLLLVELPSDVEGEESLFRPPEIDEEPICPFYLVSQDEITMQSVLQIVAVNSKNRYAIAILYS